MRFVVRGKLYNTETAELVASDYLEDGSGLFCHIINTYLYKTRRGNFFLYHHTALWKGERDRVEPIAISEAKRWYEKLPKKEKAWKDIFQAEPGY
jgi:hypothetical protein